MMTLDEAYEITSKMYIADHLDPTPEQREAKWLIYKLVLKPRFGDDDPIVQPDYMEGWRD